MSVSVRNIGTMMHSWNPRTQKTEARGTKVPGQSGYHGNNVSQKKKKLVGTKLWNFSDLVQGRWKVFQLR